MVEKMSLGYSISVELDLKFNLENIKEILEKGFKLGFSYHRCILGEFNENSPKLSSIDEVLEAIQDSFKNDELYIVFARIDSTYTNLLFIDEEGYLTVMFSGMYIFWSKKYTDGEEIDVHRYAHALLNLVNDVKILKMEISKDE